MENSKASYHWPYVGIHHWQVDFPVVWTVEFSLQISVIRKLFPCHNVIMWGTRMNCVCKPMATILKWRFTSNRAILWSNIMSAQSLLIKFSRCVWKRRVQAKIVQSDGSKQSLYHEIDYQSVLDLFNHAIMNSNYVVKLIAFPNYSDQIINFT